MKDVIIIGGGLSGLTAANYLHRQGLSIQLLEASDRVGGRVKTENKNGFLLDRGFQVFATAYPEAKVLLDYEKLDLRPFRPGAVLLQADGSRDRIGDPFRDWSSLIPTLTASAGSLGSKMKILGLSTRLKRKSLLEIFSARERPTMEVLRQEYGLGQELISRFFQPFYSGIFLEKELTTSRHMFDFVFKMFAEGDVAVPNAGMEAIPRQLAANLPADAVRTNCRAERIEENRAITTDGAAFEGKAILLATEATGLVHDYAPNAKEDHLSTTHLHFTAPVPPVEGPIIALNTLPDGLANSVVVMSQVAPGYAPRGQHLISVSIVGKTEAKGEALAKQVKAELKRWFPDAETAWQLLDERVVEYALPAQQHVRNDIDPSELRLGERLFHCGDHLLNGSINGAMRSGRLAAQAIGAALGK